MGTLALIWIASSFSFAFGWAAHALLANAKTLSLPTQDEERDIVLLARVEEIPRAAHDPALPDHLHAANEQERERPPFALVDVRRAASGHPPRHGRPLMEPIRTLLVDDVADLRMMVRLGLERSGRFVVIGEAGNGQEAIEMANQQAPDLVLLDVSMPVMDGHEALPQILQKLPATKVVMLSGFEARQLGPHALEAGAAAYLEKGIPPSMLVDELLRVMEGNAKGSEPS